MKYWVLKIGLILINIFYSIYFDYRVFRTFKFEEEFPKAVKVEKFWFLSLIGLVIFNFIFEEKLFKHRNYKFAIILLLLDFLIILPILFLTINDYLRN